MRFGVTTGQMRQAQTSMLAWSRGDGDDICRPCLTALGVSGASVSLLAGNMPHATLCATDEIAARLEELQLDLGEGPCWEAADQQAPVLIPDLSDTATRPWPLFAQAVQDICVGGLFAFPLRVGAIDLGTFDVYQESTGPLEEAVIRDAETLADTIAAAVLRRLLSETGEDLQRWENDYVDSRREVHQATGMILAQVGTAPSAAFALLRARAFSENRSVRSVARDVVARRVSFADPE